MFHHCLGHFFSSEHPGKHKIEREDNRKFSNLLVVKESLHNEKKKEAEEFNNNEFNLFDHIRKQNLTTVIR